MNSKDRSTADRHVRADQRFGMKAADAPARPAAPSPEDALRLVQELQVHQIELEMQNQELLRVQEELEASRARYFDLYDQAPVGYVTVSERGMILEANLTAASMLGVVRSALTKRPFTVFVHPDDRDAYQVQREQLGEKDIRLSWEMRMARADGSLFWAHLQVALTQNGECRITLHDITDRKRAEAALARADARLHQLQKAESLSRMAGAIAHHFNNKLQAVTGNLELALDGRPGDAGLPRFLGDAMQAASQAAEMSTLMLTFVGQARGNPKPMDLSKGCRRLVPLLRAALPVGLPLETNVPASGLVINVHEKQIPQLLINLITNAGDAIGKGTGAIRLALTTVAAANIPTVHRYPVDWEPQDTDYACLEVTDTGRGMTDKDIERIFDPFFSDKEAGRGLGLPVVLGIARAHAGAVTVRSEPGRGSTFQVFLPLFPGEIPRPSPQVAEPLRGGTVLLVDDDDLVRSVTATMLRGIGFSVVATSTGFDAVVELGKYPDAFRLVLCDLSMPGMSGWETLSALRALVPGIPAILCSGYDRAQVMAGYHPELPQAFLRKPYRSKDLSDAIRRAQGGLATPG